MIEIGIKAKDELIADSFNDKDCTLQEVSTALFRLKQIEKILLTHDFERLVAVRNKNKDKTA